MLAAGTCQDGTLCGGPYLSGCNQATLGGVRQNYDSSLRNKYFSSAYHLFPPGTHTVLLRHNSYMGCGGAYPDCISGAGVAFKVETGGR
jgi:hypothetical protein